MSTAVARLSLATRIAARLRHPNDAWLLARMVGWTLLFAALKRVAPLPALIRLARCRNDGQPRRPVREVQVVALARWAILPLQWTPRGHCLERALVAYRYLSSINATPTLVCGFKRGEDSGLAGHAWLLLDGEAVGEPAAALDDFVALLKFGPTGERVS